MVELTSRIFPATFELNNWTTHSIFVNCDTLSTPSACFDHAKENWVISITSFRKLCIKMQYMVRSAVSVVLYLNHLFELTTRCLWLCAALCVICYNLLRFAIWSFFEVILFKPGFVSRTHKHLIWTALRFYQLIILAKVPVLGYVLDEGPGYVLESWP